MVQFTTEIGEFVGFSSCLCHFIPVIEICDTLQIGLIVLGVVK